MSPSNIPTGVDPTSEATAIATVLAHAIAMRDTVNAERLDYYLNHTWADWKANVVAGILPNTNPPTPPTLVVLVPMVAPDEMYTSIGPSNVPVCPMPPIPDSPLTPIPILPPNTVDVGVHIDADVELTPTFFHVGKRNTWPLGKKTPPGTVSADGYVGVFTGCGNISGFGCWMAVGALVKIS